MASSSVSLDSAPPLPPNMRPAPQASLDQMAGQPQGQPSGAGMQGAVVEKLMLAEKSLREAAGVLPDLTPVVDDIIGRLRAGAGRVIVGIAQGQQQAAPQPPQPGGMMTGPAAAGMSGG